MKKKKPLTKAEMIAHEEQYVAFLRKRLASSNYYNSVTPDEYQKEKEKFDKAKFRLKTLLAK